MTERRGFLVSRKSAVLVENPVAAVGNGTAVARVTGLHPALFVGVGLAYFTADGHRPAGGFGANAFSIVAYDENGDGQSVQLSDTSITTPASMAAPDKWEGTTTLPQIELRHAWAGMGAADVGRWEVLVTVGPAIELCEADFNRLAGAIEITIPSKVVAT